MSKPYAEVMKSLRKEEIDVPDEIPEELGAFREPPQPGSFRFRCPQAIETAFDTLEIAVRDAEGKPIEKDGKPVTKQRITLVFQDTNALTIIQSPKGKYDEEPFSTRISNAERPRFVNRETRVAVSDMTYLLRAKAPELRPRTNEDYIEACCKILPSAEFGADVEWSGFCNPKNDAYFAFQSEAGETIYEPWTGENAAEGAENLKGCGARIYSSKWPREGGVYTERAQCTCGAWLRPYAQLVRFKA